MGQGAHAFRHLPRCVAGVDADVRHRRCGAHLPAVVLREGLGFTRVQAGAMFGFPSIASMVTLVGMTFISDRLISRGASSRMLRGVVPTIGLLSAPRP